MKVKLMASNEPQIAIVRGPWVVFLSIGSQVYMQQGSEE
jgi:hypothetical protein